jgi:hypothetical protein
MSRIGRRRNRRANSALPGYDNHGYDFGHPASREQPDLEEYGIDSDFGEEVHMGPYSSGPAPASYGWQPDHPAALKRAMERKASKCIRIAEETLGRRASEEEIEDLALRYMDLPNRAIEARLSRFADNTVIENTGYGRGEGGPANISDEVIADDEMAELMAELEADDDFMADFDDDHMDDMDDFDDDDMDFMADEMMAAKPWAFVKDHEGGPSPITGKPYGKGNSKDMKSYMKQYREWAVDGGNNPNMKAADEDLMAELMAELEDESVSAADILAEEIEALKRANARLASQVRKLADDALQKEVKRTVETDAELTEEELEEESAEPASKKAGLERLASVLADYLSEDEMAEEDDLLAEIVAEIEADQNDPRDSYMMADEEEATSHMADEDMMAEEEEASYMGEDMMGLDHDGGLDPKLARIFQAAEEEDSEDSDEDSDEDDSEEEAKEEAKEEEPKEDEKKSSKKASPRPRVAARQPAVKTLGNISREASSSHDELSKLWSTAPDVSKYFG